MSTGGPKKQKQQPRRQGRSIPSNRKELLARAKEHGLATGGRRSGHWAIWLEDDDPRAAALEPGAIGTASRPLIVPSSPGDRRAYRNAVASLLRSTGIDLARRP